MTKPTSAPPGAVCGECAEFLDGNRCGSRELVGLLDHVTMSGGAHAQRRCAGCRYWKPRKLDHEPPPTTGRRLTVIADCGETTCARAPEEFCRHVRTGRYGTQWSCDLFGGHRLSEQDGWLQRLPECMAAEVTP